MLCLALFELGGAEKRFWEDRQGTFGMGRLAESWPV